MSEAKFTPGPWEVRGPDGTGWQIHAHVPELDKLALTQEVPIRPTLSVGEDGAVHALLSYESWNQFPSTDWRQMQEANAHLIAAAHALYAELESITDAVERMALRLDKEPGNQTVVSLWLYKVATAHTALAQARGET